MKTFARTLLTAIAVGMPIAVGLFVFAFYLANKEADKTLNLKIEGKKDILKTKTEIRQSEDTIRTARNNTKTASKGDFDSFVHPAPNFVP